LKERCTGENNRVGKGIGEMRPGKFKCCHESIGEKSRYMGELGPQDQKTPPHQRVKTLIKKRTLLGPWYGGLGERRLELSEKGVICRKFRGEKRHYRGGGGGHENRAGLNQEMTYLGGKQTRLSLQPEGGEKISVKVELSRTYRQEQKGVRNGFLGTKVSRPLRVKKTRPVDLSVKGRGE